MTARSEREMLANTVHPKDSLAAQSLQSLLALMQEDTKKQNGCGNLINGTLERLMRWLDPALNPDEIRACKDKNLENE